MSNRNNPKRTAAIRKFYEEYRNGNTPLDRVEKFCRENRCFSYAEFIQVVIDSNQELYEWAAMSGRGVCARMRGIQARINIVRREFGLKPVWD